MSDVYLYFLGYFLIFYLRVVLGVIYGRCVLSRVPYPRFTVVGASLQRTTRCAVLHN